MIKINNKLFKLKFQCAIYYLVLFACGAARYVIATKHCKVIFALFIVNTLQIKTLQAKNINPVKSI